MRSRTPSARTRTICRSALSRVLEVNLRQRLGETDLPPLCKPVAGNLRGSSASAAGELNQHERERREEGTPSDEASHALFRSNLCAGMKAFVLRHLALSRIASRRDVQGPAALQNTTRHDLQIGIPGPPGDIDMFPCTYDVIARSLPPSDRRSPRA